MIGLMCGGIAWIVLEIVESVQLAARQPPSMTSEVPLIFPLAGLDRNMTASTTSLASRGSLIGVLSMVGAARMWNSPGIFLTMSVAMKLGFTQFVRVLYSVNSSAIPMVSLVTAALEAP